jgi:hypothetical protein
MARRGDGIYLRGRTWWLLVVALILTVTPTAAEARFDQQTWLGLYDSSESVVKGAAVAYVRGMADGFTIAEAMDCGGVELSGDQIAATVATLVRKNSEMPLRVAVPLSLVALKCRPAPNSIFDRARR